MSNFFNNKINQNKIYVYLLVSKINTNLISTKILISKCLLLHEYSYLINNFEKFTTEFEPDKIIESFILNYNFNNQTDFPIYPYDIFYLNRVLLHSFLFFCENDPFFINFKENLKLKNDKKSENDNIKIHFISNINYLKRIKDWSLNWKKNNFSIDKYQKPLYSDNQKNISYQTYGCLNSNLHQNHSDNDNDNENEFVFSMNTLCQYYFDFKKDEGPMSPKGSFNDRELSQNCFYFNCNYIEDKSSFERISERPNTDLITKCVDYFDEQKYIKYL